MRIKTIHTIRDLLNSVELTSEEYRELSQILHSRQRIPGDIRPTERFAPLEKLEWECPVNQMIYSTRFDFDTLDGVEVLCKGCGTYHKLVYDGNV